MRLEERHIYGSARLGMNTSRVEWEFDLEGAETTLTTIAPNQLTDAGSVEHFIGNKQYELSNHLGNVLSVISDIKTPVASGTVVSYYESVIISSQDYSPFGVTLEGRSWSAGYRYGFNGKEKDSEGMGGGGNTYDYGFRIYNANLAKFLSVDPLSASYPWYTPYQFAGNKPIQCLDLDGLEELEYTQDFISFHGQTMLMLQKSLEIQEDIKRVSKPEKIATHKVYIAGKSKGAAYGFTQDLGLVLKSLKTFEEKCGGEISELREEEREAYYSQLSIFNDLQIDRKSVEQDLAKNKQVYVVAIDIDIPLGRKREANWSEGDLNSMMATFTLLHEINAHLQNILEGATMDMKTALKQHTEYYGLEQNEELNRKYWQTLGLGASVPTKDIDPKSPAGIDLGKAKKALSLIKKL